MIDEYDREGRIRKTRRERTRVGHNILATSLKGEPKKSKVQYSGIKKKKRREIETKETKEMYQGKESQAKPACLPQPETKLVPFPVRLRKKKPVGCPLGGLLCVNRPLRAAPAALRRRSLPIACFVNERMQPLRIHQRCERVVPKLLFHFVEMFIVAENVILW